MQVSINDKLFASQHLWNVANSAIAHESHEVAARFNNLSLLKSGVIGGLVVLVWLLAELHAESDRQVKGIEALHWVYFVHDICSHWLHVLKVHRVLHIQILVA